MEEENNTEEAKPKEKTITIKKADIWKYSTFVLIAAVIVIAVIAFSGNSTETGAVTNNDATGSADVSVILKNQDLFPSLGPGNAKNVVIELADFQCPYCTLASGLPSWTAQYESQYGDLIGSAGNAEDLAKQGEIKFVYVPLSFLGQESVDSAQAAYCAEDQGMFWEMHDAIFMASDGPSENDGKYTKANLEIIAQSISGLNQNKFKDCLESDATLSKVQQATSVAQNAGFQISTPQFWVNGNKVSASWQAIQAAISA